MENENNKLICAKCGAELESDAMFCSECGAPRVNNENGSQDGVPQEGIADVSQPEASKEEAVIIEAPQDELLTEASKPETLASETDKSKENTPADELPAVELQNEEMTNVEPPAENPITAESQKEEASIAEPSKNEKSPDEEAQKEPSQTAPPAPAVSSQPAHKFCLHCGATLPPDALFCLSCGTKQDSAAQPQVVTPPHAMALQMHQQPQQQIPPQPQGYPQQPFQPGYPRQGYPQQPMQQGYPQQPQMIITQAPKSMGLALILTFLFGPLGLLYANVRDGLIMICISIAVAFLTLGFGLIFVWIGSMVWAYMDVEKYNKALMNGQIPPQSF